jgi:hypothetical protein
VVFSTISYNEDISDRAIVFVWKKALKWTCCVASVVGPARAAAGPEQEDGHADDDDGAYYLGLLDKLAINVVAVVVQLGEVVLQFDGFTFDILGRTFSIHFLQL